MADYTVNTSKHATLVATVVDRVSLNNSYGSVDVINRAALGALFVRTDGTDPTIAGDDSYAIQNNSERNIAVPASSGIVVRIISSGAGGYSVHGV